MEALQSGVRQRISARLRRQIISVRPAWFQSVGALARMEQHSGERRLRAHHPSDRGPLHHRREDDSEIVAHNFRTDDALSEDPPSHAMTPSSDHLPPPDQMERYRSYLLLMARLQLDRRWGGRIDPSDVVQQTLLEARTKWSELGTANAELAAWLRQALAHNLADALRSLRRAKRDIARERSLERALEDSSAQLGNWLAARRPTASQQVVRQEELLRLADALSQLSELQREAVVLHHLQGCSLKETAQALGRTDSATAGLLHRGLRRLREILSPDQEA